MAEAVVRGGGRFSLARALGVPIRVAFYRKGDMTRAARGAAHPHADLLLGSSGRGTERMKFEYACALLRVRGMEDVGWDPLEETATVFNDIGSLLQAPLNDYARIRLGLLVYSRMTEVDAIYLILVNMVEITARERYRMDPFHDLYRPAGRARYEQYPPSAKRVVKRVKERAAARGCDELAGLLDWFFNDAVRNAFFHSDYVLFGDEFRSREGTFIAKDGVRSSISSTAA